MIRKSAFIPVIVYEVYRPTVFDVKRRPWIEADGAPVEDVMRVVDGCPSGALSYERREANGAETSGT
ncbi:(4Fe-4S)-binding protein [Exiguobacterium sp. s168]|uniref:(4Fe-4S)-binding protein n=1 Tax=Exiguobacterium sp. s168 TaxID=2751194 RepID=UPI002036F65E|nr:(4Fe-4S)-binding protein [Exiguobacterium sp. s168]